jgi:hypothetical protein
MPNAGRDLAADYQIYREGTENAKILYINLILRALRVFAVHTS